MSDAFDAIDKNARDYIGNESIATSMANSLKIISSDIYTEEDRFVYELLQNAVDSYADVKADALRITIALEGDVLIFMHNGAPFSDADIAGISAVGSGTKANNAKKIGYKGIGFKSVFAHSDIVTISSGSNTFTFSKDYWQDKAPHKMPWQILPYKDKVPKCKQSTAHYNVATYIRLKHKETMAATVEDMLKTSKFLLFLSCDNAEITFVENGRQKTKIGKHTEGETVTLTKNGHEESRWLMHHISPKDAKIPADVRAKIANDDKTPEKLKDADTFDLSFALKLNDKGHVEPEEDAKLFTYLPTSATMGFPFLVNANFLTDAGRQQLQKSAAWNVFIMSVIPCEFLRWVATFSRNNPEYYKVLPRKTGSYTDIDQSFDSALSEAKRDVAFIPSAEGQKLLKASEAFMDRIGVAEQIGADIVLKYVNKKHNKKFTKKNFIANAGADILASYGVTLFRQSDLQELFEDQEAFAGIKAKDDITLVRGLHSIYTSDGKDQASLADILRGTRFLLDDKGELHAPAEMQFPSDFENEFSSDAIVLNQKVYDALGGVDSEIGQWLGKLGVSEASDESVVEKVICREDYITEKNAISVGRFLFRLFKKGNDVTEGLQHYQISYIKFLTQKGSLLNPTGMYISSKYKPEVDLEPAYDGDIFVSDEYMENADDRNLWKAFFGTFGIKETIELTKREFEEDDCEGNKLLCDIIRKADRIWFDYGGRCKDNTGWKFCFNYFWSYYAPLIGVSEEESPALSKKVWTKILQGPKTYETEEATYIYGHSGWWGRTLQFSEFSDGTGSFFNFAIKNFTKFPASDGTMRLASELYINSAENVELAGSFLPVIDVDCEIDESWLNTLNLKQTLTVDDLLAVLQAIRKADGNKERILKIYKELAGRISSKQAKEKIAQWAKTAKILTVGDKFASPSKLYYIGIDGFKSKDRVYTGREGKDLLPLLELMGVRVITAKSIKPEIHGLSADGKLRSLLTDQLSALATLRIGGSGSRADFNHEREALSKILEKAEFFRCESIALSYGKADDVIDKRTFSQGEKFYYVGDVRPATVEPMLSPLSRFLGLDNKERELFVILIEDTDGIIENLRENGYETKFIEEDEEEQEPEEAASLGASENHGLGQEQKVDASIVATKNAIAYLGEHGFDVSKATVEYSVIRGVKKDGEAYPVVAKSYKDTSKPLHINPAEWDVIFSPRSILLIYNGKQMCPVHARELFEYHDNITLSISSVNLEKDENIHKFMKVLHYLNGVTLDISSLGIDANRGDRLEDLLFDGNRPENSDLAAGSDGDVD